MFLPTLFSRLLGVSRCASCPVSFVQDPDAFERSAEAERMRVDRNGSTLSLLVIRLASKRSTPADVQALALLLEGRLRLTDTVGEMRDGRIGVLLPDTNEAGAWKVASDICDQYPPGSERPHCDVLVYPENWGANPGEGRREDRKGRPEEAPQPARAGRRAASFDALFARPLPLWKRTLDVTAALGGLVILSPLFAMIAIGIKFTSTGSVFFLQEREGLSGRRFKILKFRTMRVDAEDLKASLRQYSEQDGPAFKLTHDPRVTLIGRMLRKTSLDELPQLLNVLRGEMSLVGPRPLPVDESLACQPWQRRRLHVTPGITCFWQVFGRNIVPFDDWIRMDLRYVRERSPLCDLRLVAATLPAVVFSKGPR